MDIGKELIKLRLERNLTQVQVADMCGLHRSQITNIESGRHKPSLERFEMILSKFGKHLEIR